MHAPSYRFIKQLFQVQVYALFVFHTNFVLIIPGGRVLRDDALIHFNH